MNTHLLKSIALSGALFCSIIANAQTVSTFDNLTLSPDSYWDGSDNSGGFQNGNVYFTNSYDQSWFYWSGGFSYSNVADSATSGYTNQFAAKALKDYSGTGNYALGQQGSILRLTGNAAGKVVYGCYITNTTYAANSMRDGDSFAKKFGGATGNDEDWFKLIVYGFSGGNMTTDSVEFYLADYRFANNSQDYIVDSWEWIDLSSLGNVDSLIFFLSSTDNGTWGMNTPAFFALDNFTTADSPLSTEELVIDNVEIFPNPSADFITFNSSVNLYSANYFIYDQSGKLVQSGNYNGRIIDIRELNSGLYFIRMEIDDRSFTKKLIKK